MSRKHEKLTPTKAPATRQGAPARGRPTALARESERALVQQIRRLLALPPQRRTHFLRVRLPNGGSAL